MDSQQRAQLVAEVDQLIEQLEHELTKVPLPIRARIGPPLMQLTRILRAIARLVASS